MSLSDLHGRHSPVRNNIPWTSVTQELVLVGNNLMNSDIVFKENEKKGDEGKEEASLVTSVFGLYGGTTDTWAK